jgi:hypothetical protein
MTEKYRLWSRLKNIKVTTLIIINRITSNLATVKVVQLNLCSLEGPSKFNIQDNTKFHWIILVQLNIDFLIPVVIMIQ